MRFIDHAVVRPHHCAALPYIGNSNAKHGFIDTGSELDGFDNHVYLSVEAVEHMAAMIGWSSPEVVEDAHRRVEQAEAKARKLEQELVQLRAYRAAVHTLKDAGYSSARKPGRPKKEVADVA